MRIEPHDYHSIAAQEPGLVKAVGALAGNRMSGPSGLSGIAAEPPPPRAIIVGDRWDARMRRPAALPRSEPDHLHLAPARCGRRDGAVGRPVAPRGGPADNPRRRRQDRRAASAPPNRGATRARHRTGPCGVRHGDRGCGPGWAGGGRAQRLGAPTHDRDRARGAWRAGRHVVSDRELPRLSRRRLGRGAGEPRIPAGAEARRGDPRHARDRANRRREPPRVPRRRRRPPGARDRARVRRLLAAPVRRWVRSPGRQGCLVRSGTERGAEHARARRPHHRRGQLRRAGGDVLLDARTERDHRLPRRVAREGHGALPRRPDRDPAEHRALFHSEVVGRARGRVDRGDRRPQLGDRRDDAARDGRAVHLHRRRRRDVVAPAGDRARLGAATS